MSFWTASCNERSSFPTVPPIVSVRLLRGADPSQRPRPRPGGKAHRDLRQGGGADRKKHRAGALPLQRRNRPAHGLHHQGHDSPAGVGRRESGRCGDGQPKCLRRTGHQHLPFRRGKDHPARPTLWADAGQRQRRGSSHRRARRRQRGRFLLSDDGTGSGAWVPEHRVSQSQRSAHPRPPHHGLRSGTDRPGGHEPPRISGDRLHPPGFHPVGGAKLFPHPQQQKPPAGRL